MSESTQESTPPAEGPQNGAQAVPEGAQAPGGEAVEKQGIESLPEWAQRELRDARQDAGNYRTRLREAEEKLGKAKTQEEFETALGELRAENAKLIFQNDQRKAASDAGLPQSLAARLVGNSPEELKADAEAMKAEMDALRGGPKAPPPPREGPRGGGLEPQQESLGDLAGTPREIADRMRKMQRIR